MHLTAPLHWSRSIGTNGRDPSELVVTIAGMRSAVAYASALGDGAVTMVLKTPHDSISHRIAFILANYPRNQEGRGKDVADIADTLNTRGVQTARGGQWYAMTVKNVLARA